MIVDYVREDLDDGKKYTLKTAIIYYSKRYDKHVSLAPGYRSDGATGAFDIDSKGWWVHDKLCDHGCFDCGTPCTNWEASQVLQDILHNEGYRYREHYWFWSTWLFGGGVARENGMTGTYRRLT
jgi:hypothetical protein